MVKTLVCKKMINDRGAICYGKLFIITLDSKVYCNKCGNEISIEKQ